jgi:hypothetical protein
MKGLMWFIDGSAYAANHMGDKIYPIVSIKCNKMKLSLKSRKLNAFESVPFMVFSFTCIIVSLTLFWGICWGNRYTDG